MKINKSNVLKDIANIIGGLFLAGIIIFGVNEILDGESLNYNQDLSLPKLIIDICFLILIPIMSMRFQFLAIFIGHKQ